MIVSTYFGGEDCEVVGAVLGSMELEHFDERKIAAHVAVHGEEAVGISSQDLVTKVVHATCCSKSGKLL